MSYNLLDYNMEHVIGKIQGCEVIYIPEKQLIFCKNTILPLNKVLEILKSPEQRTFIPEKKMWITKDEGTISFGCLTSTTDNIKLIHKNVKRINNNC